MSDDILDRYSRDNLPSLQPNADGGFTPDDIFTKYDREPEIVKEPGKPTRVIMNMAEPRLDAGSGFQGRMVSSVPIVGPLFDKATAATGSLIQGLFNDPKFSGTTFGQRYLANLAMQDQKNEEYAKENPVRALTADVVGPSMAMAPMAQTTLGGRLLGLVGGSLGAKAYQGAAGAASIAAADQALKGNNPLNQGFFGPVPLSAAGGMFAPALGEGVVKAGSKLLDWMPRTVGDLKGVNSVGRSIIVNALEGETPASIAEAKNTFGKSGLLSDVNNATTDAAGALADIPGPHKEVIREAFRERAAGQKDRILESLDKNTVPRVDVGELGRLLELDKQTASKPLYDQFRSMTVKPTDEIKSLIPRLEAAGAFDKAEQLAGISGRPFERNFFTGGPSKSFPTTEAWDFVKRSLDSKISAALDSTKPDKALASELLKLKGDMLSEIDKTPAGKVWKQAREKFADYATLQEEMKNGAKTWDRQTTWGELKHEMSLLTPFEQAARRQGARDAIQNIIENSLNGDTQARNKLLTDAGQKKLEILFGQKRAENLVTDLKAELYGKQKVENVIGGSQTTPKKERTNAMLPAPSEMGYLANLDVTKPASFIPEWAKPHTIMEGAKAQRYADAYRQIAPLLVTKMGEPKFDSLVQSLLQERARKEAVVNSLVRLGSAATGGVAATLPSLRQRLVHQPATP